LGRDGSNIGESQNGETGQPDKGRARKRSESSAHQSSPHPRRRPILARRLVKYYWQGSPTDVGCNEDGETAGASGRLLTRRENRIFPAKQAIRL
jgi:hypothetical protein